MAVEIIDARIWFAEYALSSDHNRLELTVGHESQDGTVFTDTAKRVVGTAPMVNLTGAGFVQFGNTGVHAALRGNLNVSNVPVTIGMEGGDDGTKAEFFLAKALQYSTGARAGELLPFTWSAGGQGVPSVDGTILGVGSKTSTANGTARQFGTLDSTERMYAAQHVIAASGTSPTLDTVIASDNAEGFSSGTTRLTFAQKTAVGSEWLSLDGPVATDDWWRAQWTIGGTDTPTFSVVIVVGIVTLT